MKHPIHQLEYPITTHCNLRCVDCDHLVPHLEKDDIPLTVFKADLERALSHFDMPKFGLVGGEPTLHHDIDAVIDYASKRLPTFIVTNGLRLLKMEPETLRKLTTIRISVYPELKFDYRNMIFTLEDVLKGSNCRLDVRNQDGFFPAWVDTILPVPEARRIYDTCDNAHSWKCYTLYKGSFYKCGRSHLADEQARIIGLTNTSLMDGVMLDLPDFDERFAVYMSRDYMPKACFVCNGTHAPSLPHRQATA